MSIILSTGGVPFHNVMGRQTPPPPRQEGRPPCPKPPAPSEGRPPSEVRPPQKADSPSPEGRPSIGGTICGRPPSIGETIGGRSPPFQKVDGWYASFWNAYFLAWARMRKIIYCISSKLILYGCYLHLWPCWFSLIVDQMPYLFYQEQSFRVSSTLASSILLQQMFRN